MNVLSPQRLELYNYTFADIHEHRWGIVSLNTGLRAHLRGVWMFSQLLPGFSRFLQVTPKPLETLNLQTWIENEWLSDNTNYLDPSFSESLPPTPPSVKKIFDSIRDRTVPCSGVSCPQIWVDFWTTMWREKDEETERGRGIKRTEIRILGEKYGRVQRWKDGFNSVYRPWPFYAFEKMRVAPRRVRLHLQDTHDWCAESFLGLFAPMSSEVYGLLTWSSILFLEFKWNQGIEDGMRQASVTVHPQSAVIGPPARLLPFKTDVLPTSVEEFPDMKSWFVLDDLAVPSVIADVVAVWPPAWFCLFFYSWFFSTASAYSHQRRCCWHSADRGPICFSDHLLEYVCGQDCTKLCPPVTQQFHNRAHEHSHSSFVSSRFQLLINGTIHALLGLFHLHLIGSSQTNYLIFRVFH